MDLTEIMDFLDGINDGDENKKETTEASESQKTHQNQVLTKAPKRNRANTWHDDDDTNNFSYNPASSSLKTGTPPKTGIISRKSIARRNAWGNLSYADMITQAINSTPEKRMTLSEIYNWMVQNIAFFRDKGESNSSAGWKNSIRHNLSLHNCFMRVQNEGAGKSSWWVLNPEYRVTRPQRRRTSTVESSPKNATKKSETTSPLADSTTLDTPIRDEGADEICRDFRPRSKTFSSKLNRLSPTMEDQEEQNYEKRFKAHPQQNYLPFINIPAHSHLQNDVKCASFPSAWNFTDNYNSFNNTPVDNSNGSRLLSGGSMLCGQKYRKPFSNYYGTPPNYNHAYYTEDLSGSPKSLKMLMSGGVQLPSSNSWLPKQPIHTEKKDHALLMRLLTEKQQSFPQEIQYSLPQTHPTTLQNLLTTHNFSSDNFSNPLNELHNSYPSHINPPPYIKNEDFSRHYLDPIESIISPTTDIPDDPASIDSFFSSDIDAGFVSPINIDHNINQVINCEKLFSDSFDSCFTSDNYA